MRPTEHVELATKTMRRRTTMMAMVEVVVNRRAASSLARQAGSGIQTPKNQKPHWL
jgi:hypothetical protein